MTITVRISHLSTEYIGATATIKASGGTFDPDTVTGAIAVVRDDTDPNSDDWHTADVDVTSTTITARLLIGPDSALDLPTGKYDVWLRVNDDPETIVRLAGTLRVT